MPSWAEILEQIKSIRKAPVAAVLVAVTASVPTWGAAQRYYSGILAGKNAQIEYLDQQNLDCRDRLGKTASAEPQGKHRPKLMLAMTGVNVALTDTGSEHERLTGMGINVKLWNAGAPSVATEWLLYVTPEGAASQFAQLVPGKEPIRTDGPIGSFLLRVPETFEVKTKSKPIQSTPIEGTLFFNVAMKRETVLAPTTRLDLIVKDADGKETKATKYMAEWLQR
jgi:hypothetical protein